MKIQRATILPMLTSLALAAAMSPASAQNAPSPTSPYGPGMGGPMPAYAPPGNHGGPMGYDGGGAPAGSPYAGGAAGMHGPPPGAYGGMPPQGMGMPPQAMYSQAMAQGMPPQGMPPQGMPPQGMPQGMPPQNGGPVYGGEVAAPAYCDPYSEGMMSGGSVIGQGHLGPSHGYGGGHAHRSWKNWLVGGAGWLAPYDEGGCCHPHWYDVYISYMSLDRDETVTQRQDFTSLGIGGDIVLSTDDLAFDNADGFRIIGSMQIAAGSSLEAVYFGQHRYSSAAEVFDENDRLFSVFSDFGTDPAGGFVPTGFSDFQRIEYVSEIDNAEINYRYRWQTPGCGIQGSWIVGARYFYLDEEFRYQTTSNIDRDGDLAIDPAALDYQVSVHNSLTGGQLGGDMWYCVIPGLNFGWEWKGGVFGRHAGQATSIVTTENGEITLNEGERFEASDVSFVGEIGIMGTYRFNQQWTLRAGYHWLWVNNVALAAENFNPNPPMVDPDRPLFINDNTDISYSGANIGLEYLW